MRTWVPPPVALAATMTALAATTSARADAPRQVAAPATPAPTASTASTASTPATTATTATTPPVPADTRGPAFTLGAQPAWYLLAGVTTGDTFVAHDRGGYVGGEASIVRLGRSTQFSGFYADGYHDCGASRTYVTSGIETGYKLVGVDGGLATRFGGDRPEWGGTARLFVGVGVVSIYGRYAYFADSLGRSDEHVVQVGVLVKMPFNVWGMQ